MFELLVHPPQDNGKSHEAHRHDRRCTLHGCTATEMSFEPRRTVVRSLTRPTSWPQAASMSSPRVRRVVAITPLRIEDLAEPLDRRRAGALVARARKRVERNQVHFRRPVLEQLHELVRVLRVVVDAVEHHVLERDAARVLLVHVLPASIEQLGDRMLAVDRHQLVAQRVVRRVQRHGQRAVGLLGEPQHLRHEAGRADRDTTARDVEAEIVHHDLGGRHHVAIVRERLAHAHEDDIGDDAVAAGLLVARARDSRATPGRRSPRRVRLRLKPCCAVEQNVQSIAQPTWLEMHSVPRPGSGMKTISMPCVRASIAQQPLARAVGRNLRQS